VKKKFQKYRFILNTLLICRIICGFVGLFLLLIGIGADWNLAFILVGLVLIAGLVLMIILPRRHIMLIESSLAQETFIEVFVNSNDTFTIKYNDITDNETSNLHFVDEVLSKHAYIKGRINNSLIEAITIITKEKIKKQRSRLYVIHNVELENIKDFKLNSSIVRYAKEVKLDIVNGKLLMLLKGGYKNSLSPRDYLTYEEYLRRFSEEYTLINVAFNSASLLND
jgi:hypothetical protein